MSDPSDPSEPDIPSAQSDAKQRCVQRLESALAALEDASFFAKRHEISRESNIADSIEETLADVRALVSVARSL